MLPPKEKAVGTKQKADSRQGQELQDQELRNQIEQIASAAKGRVGVSAVVLETGESVSLNPYPQIAQITQVQPQERSAEQGQNIDH